jgi:hypothetical protein
LSKSLELSRAKEENVTWEQVATTDFLKREIKFDSKTLQIKEFACP